MGGAVIGASLGAISGFDTGDYIPMGAYGALGGVALGTLVGAAIRTERWERAALEGPEPAPSVAEIPSAEASGARVRVSAPAAGVRKLTGSLVAVGADSLFVRESDSGETRVIPRSSVTQIWFSDGSRANTWRGALIGFAAGAVVGGVWALGIGAREDWDCGEVGCEVLALLPAAGAAGGLGAGALLGSFVETERWKARSPADLRLTLQPVGLGGARLGVLLSYAF